jgi:two-component sensor histidine kinase
VSTTVLKKAGGTSQISPGDYSRAILNILEDFSEEKAGLERTQRAVMNIIDDSALEKINLEGTQSAVLNILQDFTEEKGRLEETQRAVFNILEDFSGEKLRLEGTQSAMLNLLEDFDRERVKTEAARSDLQQINAQLRQEMEERGKAEDAVKKSLREKEVLLREIHHRVKNNLQIIQSMLKLQLPQIKDEKAIALFKESQNRVYSMALIHEKLYQSESLSRIDFPEYIKSLTAYLFTSYGAAGRSIRPNILVKDISLDVDTTIPCALIINELVSNSLKHAFPASRHTEGPGEISIDLHHDAGERFLLTVSDNGVGLPEGFEMDNRDSLGLKLVGVLVKQLGGSIRLGRSGTGGGAEFIISFAARKNKGA